MCLKNKMSDTELEFDGFSGAENGPNVLNTQVESCDIDVSNVSSVDSNHEGPDDDVVYLPGLPEAP
jgi:hypothetical protein